MKKIILSNFLETKENYELFKEKIAHLNLGEYIDSFLFNNKLTKSEKINHIIYEFFEPGSTLKDIVDFGRVGCSDCYDKFEDRLAPSIEKIHGNVKHIGKNVTYTETTNNKKQTVNDTLTQLKEELKQAVKEQRFEDAAVIRDKIKALGEEK